jgi:hypothetical protein
MFVVKQCTCGSTNFEFEYDDDVLRCAECGRLARFENIPDNEEKEENEIL